MLEDKDLVLFWGWSNADTTYKHFVDTAPKGWNIYQVSYAELMPGGKTGLFRDNAMKFLNSHGLDKAYIAGHSLGGALGLEFAYHHPEKVQRLYLVDSEGIYGYQTIFQIFKNVLSSGPNPMNREIEGTWRRLKRMIRNPLTHIRLGYYAHHIDLQHEARGLKVPTTILWGEQDRLTPLWQGQKLHQLIPNSKLIVLAEQGHDWILYSPEEFWNNVT